MQSCMQTDAHTQGQTGQNQYATELLCWGHNNKKDA